MMNLYGLKSCGRLGVVLPVLLAMLWGTPAAAFQFEFDNGVQGSFDSTLSYGMSWRVSDRDKDIIGTANKGYVNGANAYSVNGDDGNLNYDDGETFSRIIKLTSELDLGYENFGLFVRGSVFYDFENETRDRERTELSDDAKDMVGKDAELLDAYIWANYELGEMPGQVRLGDQVLSWGESTFIQNGINVINPLDVSKLRVPGAELKEGLVPVGMVSASISPTENLTFEGFYQYDWEKVEIDPTGFYWSTNDFAGESGRKVMLAFGDVSDMGTDFSALGPLRMFFGLDEFEEDFLGVTRIKDEKPSDDGQYGLAMRVVVPQLNETEFGFYFMNYHSRLPIISGVTGTEAGVAAAQGIWDIAATPSGLLGGATPLQALEGSLGTTGAIKTVTSVALDKYSQTANYFIEYPEDIKLYGVSFNTQLSGLGMALQGEVSYREDVPIQVDDVELLLAALTPVSLVTADLTSLAGLPPVPPALPPYVQYRDNQLGVFAPSSIITGYEELDVSQIQMTATQLFGPTFGADQFVIVGEVGMTHVHDLPSKSKLRFESPATYVTGNSSQSAAPFTDPTKPLGGAHSGKPAESSDAFADATSWGYRIVTKMDFNNAIGAVTLSPRIAWAHDVDGNTPGPGGNFLEDRKAITFGLGANYLNAWTADLSYTDYFGANRYNLINDRDFVAFNVKYSF